MIEKCSHFSLCANQSVCMMVTLDRGLSFSPGSDDIQSLYPPHQRPPKVQQLLMLSKQRCYPAVASHIIFLPFTSAPRSANLLETGGVRQGRRARLRPGAPGVCRCNLTRPSSILARGSQQNRGRGGSSCGGRQQQQRRGGSRAWGPQGRRCRRTIVFHDQAVQDLRLCSPHKHDGMQNGSEQGATLGSSLRTMASAP